MSIKVLVTYETVSGSTGEIARWIGNALIEEDVKADVLPISHVRDVAPYDAVVIGGPMRFGGFIKSVRRFIEQHEMVLGNKTVAYFVSCLYVIESSDEPIPGLSPFIDPSLEIGSRPRGEMNYFDKTHRLAYYVELLRGISTVVTPLEIAFFNGRLDLGKLPFFTRLFMKVVTLVTAKEKVGDFVNPAAVRDWSPRLVAALEETCEDDRSL